MEKRRCDLALAERVRAALHQSSFAAIFTRQVALDLARRVAGVERVIDQIQVHASAT